MDYCFCAENPHRDDIDFLLQSNDIGHTDAGGNTVISSLLCNNTCSPGLVKHMFDRGVTLKQIGTGLGGLIDNEQHFKPILKALVEAGADLNCQDSDGATVLAQAAYFCLEEGWPSDRMQIYVDFGCDVNLLGVNG